MRLSSSSFEQLYEALLDAFSSSELGILVRIGMGVDLEEIASREVGRRKQVAEIIKWAESHERVEELLEKAREAKPRNRKLAAVELAYEIGSDRTAVSRSGGDFTGRDIDKSTTTFDQRGQTVGGSQINIGGDASIGRIGADHYHLPIEPKMPPMEISRRAEHFHGRKELIEDVLGEIYPGRVVTLYGIGGIGKTAVVAEVVDRLQETGELLERFPDGVIFHTFYGRPSVGRAMEHILNSIGVVWNGDIDDAVRMALGDRKLMVILDGAEEADDLGRLMTFAASCGVLITSRKRSDTFGKSIQVKQLDEKSAEALLTGWAGERVKVQEVSRKICELVGNLPLAVQLIGRYLASSRLTAEEYLTWLLETDIEALDFGGNKQESIRVLLEKSAAQVGVGARQALTVAGIMALSSFGVETMVAALGSNLNKVLQQLGELVNYGLLERPDDRYIISHPLVHNFARASCELDVVQLLRLVDYFLDLAGDETKKGTEGFAWLDEEWPHIVQLIKICEEQEQWDSVKALVWAIEDYLDDKGLNTERIESLEVSSRAAQATGDRHSEGTYLGELGIAYATIGQVEKAIVHYKQALNILKEIGDRSNEEAILGNLGNSYYYLDKMEKAKDYYQQALETAKEIGDRSGEATSLGNIGLVYQNLGHVEMAIDYYKRALKITRSIGDRSGESGHLGNLGPAYADLGQIEKAIDFYWQAIEITKENGDRSYECRHLGNLGSEYTSLGQFENAIDVYEQAVQISKEDGDRGSVAYYLRQQGYAYAALGQLEKAIDNLLKALNIAEEIGDRKGESKTMGNLGKAYAELSHLETAIDYYEKAVKIAQEIGDRVTEGNILGNLGIAYRKLGQAEKAIEYFEQAVIISEDLGDRSAEGNNVGNIGLAHDDLGQEDKAIEFMEKALELFEEIKSPKAEQARVFLQERKKE